MTEKEVLRVEERGMALLLFRRGFKYIARDEQNGLFAYVNKPTKHNKPDNYWHAPGHLCVLNADYFSNIKSDFLYEICKDGKVRIARTRNAKAVAL